MIVCRSHSFRPRLVLPNQAIHFSVFSDDVYTPRATLASGVDIPTMPQKTSYGLWTTEPRTTEHLDEGAMTRSLISLLSSQQNTLKSLGEVLVLLHFSKLHPQSTHRRHTSDAFELSRDRKWTDSNNTHTTLVGDAHLWAGWF